MPCLAARPERGATRPSIHHHISNGAFKTTTPNSRILTCPHWYRNRNIRIDPAPPPLRHHHISRTVQVVPRGVRTPLRRRPRLVTQQLNLERLFSASCSSDAGRDVGGCVEGHEGCRCCGAGVVCGRVWERLLVCEGCGVDYFCAFREGRSGEGGGFVGWCWCRGGHFGGFWSSWV